MMGLPNWLRGREDDLDMTHDDEVHVPEIAKVEPRMALLNAKGDRIGHIDLPGSFEASHDQAAAVVAQAHSYIEQWKLERVAQQKLVDELRTKLAEVILQLKSEERKSGLLELDIATAQNNLQTQQTQIEEYRKFMSVWKEMNDRTRAVFDRFGVQLPPKKERKPNAKATKGKKETTDRKETNHPVEKDPNI